MIDDHSFLMKTCLICWGGNALPALFTSLPVILFIFTVEEVTWSWAYVPLALVLGYNWVVVWNFRCPIPWLYLCIIQISVSKGFYKSFLKTIALLSIKWSNLIILYLLMVMVSLTLLFLYCIIKISTNFCILP